MEKTNQNVKSISVKNFITTIEAVGNGDLSVRSSGKELFPLENGNLFKKEKVDIELDEEVSKLENRENASQLDKRTNLEPIAVN